MFENFGIKDVFVGLWKFKYYLLVLVVISSIGISGMTFLFNHNQPTESIRYKTECLYYFSPVKSRDDKPVLNAVELSGGQVALTYTALIGTQSCLEDIVRKIEDSGVTTTTEEVKNSISYKVLSDNYTLSLSINSGNEQLVQLLAGAFDAYFLDTQETLYDMGEESIHKLEDEGISKQSVITQKNYGKICLVSAGISLLFGCIAVFFLTLFKPTLNRKNDFKKYGIDVLGEIKK